MHSHVGQAHMFMHWADNPPSGAILKETIAIISEKHNPDHSFCFQDWGGQDCMVRNADVCVYRHVSGGGGGQANHVQASNYCTSAIYNSKRHITKQSCVPHHVAARCPIIWHLTSVKAKGWACANGWQPSYEIQWGQYRPLRMANYRHKLLSLY